MKYLGAPQSGSHANLTASRNRFGQYYRNRATPVNPATPSQSDARDSLSTLSNAWRLLTAAKQSAWQTLANEFPIVNSLGQTVILSGHSQYVRSNTALNLSGLGAIDVPVAFTTWSGGVTTLTAAAGTPTLSLAFSAPGAGQALIVDMSQQRSPGRTFESDYRHVVALVSTDTSPEAILAGYTAKFGLLIEGKAIFVRGRILNECGIYGPPQLSRWVVAA